MKDEGNKRDLRGQNKEVCIADCSPVYFVAEDDRSGDSGGTHAVAEDGWPDIGCLAVGRVWCAHAHTSPTHIHAHGGTPDIHADAGATNVYPHTGPANVYASAPHRHADATSHRHANTAPD